MTDNLTSTIDALGKLQVQIAVLEAQAKALKAVLVEVGPGRYLGDSFQVTVTAAGERDQLDMDAVRAFLSPQFKKAHTTKVKVSSAVRVSARMDAVAA